VKQQQQFFPRVSDWNNMLKVCKYRYVCGGGVCVCIYIE
jgi:hypothetical protein